MRWRDDIDPTTIPDGVLYAEVGRRRGAKRRTNGAGPGRPATIRRCECGGEFTLTKYRRHRCEKKLKNS